MATATRKIPPTSPTPPPRPEARPAPSLGGRIVGAVEALYRFLASVKLAVFSLASLAATLAFATVFESIYGTAAVNEYVYRGPWFALLLAFLGTNILCAALIRYPWKKRQTGFVITHAGLLVILAGSLYSVRTADEGQVGMLEGDVRDELVRERLPGAPGQGGRSPRATRPFAVRPAISPRRVLVGTGSAPAGRRALALLSRHLRPGGVVGDQRGGPDPERHALPPGGEAIPGCVRAGDDPRARSAGLADGANPPSLQAPRHAERAGGAADRGQPVVRDRPQILPRRRASRCAGRPALLTFSAVDRPELVEDFLKSPAVPGTQGVARFRYADSSGKPRVFDWPLQGNKGKSVALPDSDLSVSLSDILEFPTQERGLNSLLGDDPIPIALFKIQRAGGEPMTHMALANLPMVPNLIPSLEEQEGKTPPKRVPSAPLATIHYMFAPTIDPQVNRRFGQIDVLAGPDGSLHYRVYGRARGLRASCGRPDRCHWASGSSRSAAIRTCR